MRPARRRTPDPDLGSHRCLPLQSELGSVHDKDVRMELLKRFLTKAPEQHGDELAALIGDVLESRESEVEAVSTKTAWLVSEKIPERLRSLLD